MDQIEVQYRQWRDYVLPPQRTRLEVPGWAGEQPAGESQPWECKPFVDGATLGLELRWGLKSTVTATSHDGANAQFHGNFFAETGCETTFGQFAPGHYGVNTHLALRTPPGWGLMILPHPKWFAAPDESNLPAILPGVIEFDWWPNCFFVVSRVPRRGRVHLWQYGEPFAQVVPVPVGVQVQPVKMSADEAAEHDRVESFVRDNYMRLSTRSRVTPSGKPFGNVYKVLSQEFRKHGKIDWAAHAKAVADAKRPKADPATPEQAPQAPQP